MKRFMCFFVLASVFFSAILLAETPAKTSDTAQTAKLDKIISDQQEILRQLSEIKNELLIVKARATR